MFCLALGLLESGILGHSESVRNMLFLSIVPWFSIYNIWVYFATLLESFETAAGISSALAIFILYDCILMQNKLAVLQFGGMAISSYLLGIFGSRSVWERQRRGRGAFIFCVRLCAIVVLFLLVAWRSKLQQVFSCASGDMLWSKLCVSCEQCDWFDDCCYFGGLIYFACHWFLLFVGSRYCYLRVSYVLCKCGLWGSQHYSLSADEEYLQLISFVYGNLCWSACCTPRQVVVWLWSDAYVRTHNGTTHDHARFEWSMRPDYLCFTILRRVKTRL